jgi:hypothetical protein
MGEQHMKGSVQGIIMPQIYQKDGKFSTTNIDFWNGPEEGEGGDDVFPHHII